MECVFPGFLLKIHPDSAWIFIKMSPDEELDTLFLVNFNIFPCLHINFSLWDPKNFDCSEIVVSHILNTCFCCEIHQCTRL